MFVLQSCCCLIVFVMRCVAVVILIDLSLSSIVTFVMRLFAVKPVAYIRSLGRWQVVGFGLGAMVEKIESV